MVSGNTFQGLTNVTTIPKRDILGNYLRCRTVQPTSCESTDILDTTDNNARVLGQTEERAKAFHLTTFLRPDFPEMATPTHKIDHSVILRKPK